MIPKPLVLRKEDYKDAPAWAVRLFQQLNEWFTTTTQALTRGLVRSENMRSTVKVITFTASATVFPLTVKHDLGQRPTDAWIGRIRTRDNSAITSAVSMTWDTDTDGNLVVRFQGLSDGVPYEARIVIE